MSLFKGVSYEDYFDYNAIAAKMQERLRLHHSIYTSRCKDSLLEENFHNALIQLNVPNNWKTGSHTVKYDIITNGPDIGIKSGQIDFKKNCLTYSGSRLGSHKTIENKVSFLENNKPYFTFFMAEVKKKKSYFFCVLQNSVISYDLPWKQKDKTFEASSDNYRVVIRESMSDQLWSEINLNLFSYIKEIEI